MVDIFEEIKEEAKEEQWLNLWKKYQNHVYGFILGCVVLTSAYVFWQRHQMSQNVEASGKYIAGLRASGSNQLKTALSILEDIPLNTGGAYKDLSRFMVASLLQDQGDDQGAKEVYRGIVNDTGASKEYKNLALLRLAYLGFDSEDPKALLKSLDGLIGSKSPWRFSALELTALLQLKLKNEKGAKEAISKIMEEKGNKSIPPYLLFRVEALKRSMEQN